LNLLPGKEAKAMRDRRNGNFTTQRSVGILITLLLGTAVALAQQTPAPSPVKEAPAAKDTISGKYEGVAKTAGAADIQLTLELKNEAGKLSGRLITPQGAVEFTGGTLTENKVSLKLGAAGKDGALAGQLQDGKLVGEWTAGAQKRAVELKKLAAGGDPASLSGEWIGLADVEGGFPFNLTLKVDGEKVTGSSTSQLGDSTITSGSWKDGQLTFVLESANYNIGMSAALVDGKLVGSFDFNGQTQGKWVATKKAP
jgi:hypothetical protein